MSKNHRLRPQANVVSLPSVPSPASGSALRQWYTIQAKGSKKAEILIYSDIGDSFFSQGVTAAQFAKDLRALGEVHDLSIRIGSYGGDARDAMVIYRLLADHPAATKNVYVDSLAASAASVVAMSGKRIYIAEPAQIMIHDAWGGKLGNAESLRKYADMLDSSSEQMAKVYADRTGNSMAKVRQWMKEETWFTSAEALKYNFAQEVQENVKMAASANTTIDLAVYGFKNVPRQFLASHPVREQTRETLRRWALKQQNHRVRDRANAQT